MGQEKKLPRAKRVSWITGRNALHPELKAELENKTNNKK
jgi:hypothetical protein